MQAYKKYDFHSGASKALIADQAKAMSRRQERLANRLEKQAATAEAPVIDLDRSQGSELNLDLEITEQRIIEPGFGH